MLDHSGVLLILRMLLLRVQLRVLQAEGGLAIAQAIADGIATHLLDPPALAYYSLAHFVTCVYLLAQSVGVDVPKQLHSLILGVRKACQRQSHVQVHTRRIRRDHTKIAAR